MIALYRIEFLKRKWWFPFCCYFSACTVNALHLRMKVTGEKESCLDFLRELVVHIFTRHSVGPAHIEAIPLTGNMKKGVRFDGSNHWITEPTTRARKSERTTSSATCSGSGT